MYYESLGYVFMVLIFICINNFRKTELDFEIDYRKGRGL